MARILIRVVLLIRVLLAILVASLAGLAGAVAPVGAVQRTDIHGDDSADRYVGTGGLILPRSVSQPTRTRVASCLDCHWRLSGPCLAEVTPGRPFPGQEPVCLGVVRGCPAQAELLRTWFQEAGGPWQDLGLVCIGPGGPVTVARLGTRVQGSFAEDLPALRPGTSPPDGVLTQLPVAFAAGQPGHATFTNLLLGQRVTIDADATWEWTFGDGGRLATGSAGGAYPDLSVAHTYRTAGVFVVTVTSRWSARFTVDGLGPFPVEETVEQTVAQPLAVGEGRAVLAVR